MKFASQIIRTGLFAITGMLAATSSAAVVQSNYYSADSQEAFPASATSLIQNGAPSLLGASATVTPNGGITPLNDGGTSAISYLDSTYSVTYVLDTSINTAGYDLSSISTISGWTASRIAQLYSIDYTTVTNASPAQLTSSVSYDPAAEGSAKVMLTDSSGLLASGVNSITFNIYNPGFGTVYRELEVEGTPTAVPEPVSMTFLGLGAAILLRRRR